MTSKLLIIIASENPEVIKTALTYTYTAYKERWLDDIKLVFFGPSEKTLAKEEELQPTISKLQREGIIPLACKAVAQEENIEEKLIDLGITVEYIGSYISQKIREGYQTQVW